MGLKIFKKTTKYPSIVTAYDKIRKCIKSSKTVDQLKCCDTMISIFRQNYSDTFTYERDLENKKYAKKYKLKY